MRVTLTITYSSGEVVPVRTTPLAWMRWEKRTGKSASDLATAHSVTDLLLLAYESLRVAGITVPADPEQWAATVDDVGAGSEIVPPTVPVPSADSSPRSPS